jgi:flagellar basal-body rod protein FlgG
MDTHMRRLAVEANNLANARTPGYKQDRVSAESFELVLRGSTDPLTPVLALPSATALELAGTVGSGIYPLEPVLDLSQGGLYETGERLDLALVGPGFFAVQTPEGERYTRAGNFAVDGNGLLRTATGDLVLGEQGPIQVGTGDLSVGSDGTIYVNGNATARLRLVEFDVPALQKAGENYLVPREPAAAPRLATGTQVRQGYLESSNVDLSRTMVSLFEIQRAYELSARALQMQDQTLGQAINDVGRVGSAS